MSKRFLLISDMKGPGTWVVAIAFLIVVFSIINPRFASVENLRNVLEQTSVRS